MPAIDNRDARVPIIVGVTGHRDLIDEDIPDLQLTIKSILDDLKAKYSFTPIRILSALAEGADRLVARVALDLGLSFTAVLPMPQEEYEKDFSTTESKEEFWDLLQKAESIYELPLAEGNTLENIKDYNENRNKQYAAVGAYLAINTQILIALWNGSLTGETGGTSEVVHFKLFGIPKPYQHRRTLLDYSDSGVVFHIFTRRRFKQHDIKTKPAMPEIECIHHDNSSYSVLYPINWEDKCKDMMPSQQDCAFSESEIAKKGLQAYFSNILIRINNLNEDILTRSQQEKVKVSRSYILAQEEQQKLLPGLREILDLYGHTDALAMHYRDKTVGILKAILASAVMAFFFFGAFDELWSSTIVLLLFPVSVCLGYLLFSIAGQNVYEEKFFDYRAIAEGLRIQFFWKMADINENVYDRYLQKYAWDIGWIPEVLRNASMLANQKIFRDRNGNRTASLFLVQQNWIEDQKRYFTKNVHKKRMSLLRQNRFTTAFFCLAFLLVSSFFGMKAIDLIQEGSLVNVLDMSDVKDWDNYSVFLVLIDTFIAIGAARAAYVEKRAFSDEVKQFERMNIVFHRASEIMEDALRKEDFDTAERLMIELGEEALMENADWLVLKRSRPLEVSLG